MIRDMEILFISATLLQSMFVSLGVGASTLAVLNFLVAIKDGVIDLSERAILGMIYIVLRVAMVGILLTTMVQAMVLYSVYGMDYYTPVATGAWILIGVLFLNAILMTLHVMPSKFGPAIQAGSWYTLGILSALVSVRMTDFTLTQFILGYITMVLIAVVIINGAMQYLKSKQKKNA